MISRSRLTAISLAPVAALLSGGRLCGSAQTRVDQPISDPRKKGLFLKPILLLALCAVMPPAATAARRPTLPKPVLRALIITPEPSAEPAKGIAQLLKSHRIEAKVVSWKEASDSLASRYDVLVVAGRCKSLGRSNTPKADVKTSYGKPVLAVGPYGCEYLGFAKLKNGWPYT